VLEVANRLATEVQKLLRDSVTPSALICPP